MLDRLAMCRPRLFAIASAVGLLSLGFLSTSAQADRVRGIDVSQWQGSMDWEQAYDSDVRFTFVRSSRGGQSAATGGYDDTRFLENMSKLSDLAASGKRIYAGAYHFARPDLVATTNGQPTVAAIRSSARAEAAHFVDVAGDYMVGGFLRPVLDLEQRGGEDNTPTSTPLTPANLRIWANAFLNRVELLAGVEPLIYMNTNYASNFVDDGLANRDLWVANWNQTRYGNPVTGNGNPPTGVFDDWSFWQYSADGNGMGATFGASSNDIDLNVANGGMAFVETFVIPIPEPTSLALASMAGLVLLRRQR